MGQSVGGLSTVITETAVASDHDRAKNSQFDKIYDVISSRPQNINCGSAGSGAAPTGSSQKGSGSGGTYSASKASTNLRTSQTNVGLTSTIPKAKDITPNDIHSAQTGIGLCLSYVPSNGVLADLCKDAGHTPAGKSPYRNAHVDGTTLVMGPQKTGDTKIVKRNSIKPDSVEHEAMIANLQLLFENTAPPVLSKNQMSTGSGLTFLGLLQKWLASIGLARQVAENQINSFIVDPDTITALKHVQQQDSAWLSKYLEDIPDWQNGVSASLMRDIEVDRRGANPDWVTSVAAMDDAERATEALYMQAKSLQMQRDLLESINSTNLLLAKLVQSQSENILKEVKHQQERAISEAANLNSK